MKKHWFYNWQIWFGAALVALSVSIYTLEYLIFHNRQTIAVWILNDLAFIPISVLLVTMVLDQLMLSRDRQARMEKNNMVIGAFFSEVGSNLLGWLAQYDPKSSEIGRQLLQKHAFDPINVKQLKDGCCNYGFEVKMSVQAFNDLKALLAGKREFMVRLLENQSLMEHEAFTDLLWATFHLADELSLRNNYDSLPDPDRQHLALDVKRSYRALYFQWLDYLMHLKRAYPYLFSLAVRMNPFNKEASPIITN